MLKRRGNLMSKEITFPVKTQQSYKYGKTDDSKKKDLSGKKADDCLDEDSWLGLTVPIVAKANQH